MIRFEVTGATPEEFAENAMRAWALLAIGLQDAVQRMAAQVSSPSSAAASSQSKVETSGSESSSTASKADEVSEEVVDFVMEMDRRGGLIREKIDERERKKVRSDKLDDLFVETPSSASAVAPSKSKTKGPKLDDLKTRLSEVIVAATERWDQKRANRYARTLLKRMGAEKLSELEPEKYDEFMIMSALYLSGTAAE